VRNNAYRLLAETFPIQTKSRLLDMLQESRTYTRSVREQLFASAKKILEENQDQLCKELNEWLEGKRQEDPVELEKARMREEEAGKRVEKGSRSRPHAALEEENVLNLYTFLGKVAVFTMLLFCALIYIKYFGPDKPQKKRMTYSSTGGGYDATKAADAFSAMPEAGSDAPVRIRRRTSFPFRSAPAFAPRGSDRIQTQINRARTQTEQLLDKAQVEDSNYRNMMLNAAGGNERIIRAEESLARGGYEEALTELREALAETPDHEIPTRCRIMFSMLECLKKLNRSQEYAEMAEVFDIERQKVSEMSMEAGLFSDEESVTMEKLRKDGEAIAGMKASVQALSAADRESFMQSMRKELASSGLKGRDLEFEFSVLKKRFGL